MSGLFLAGRLRVDLPAISNVAAVLDAQRVVMRPVHQTTQIIPLVNAADIDAVSHAQGHSLREIDVMRDQECASTADIDDESLMPGSIVVIGQKAPDKTGDFDPASIIAFFVGLAHRCQLTAAIKNAASHFWPPRSYAALQVLNRQ